MSTSTPWETHAGWWQERVHRRRRPRVRGADPPARRAAPRRRAGGCSTSAAARARSPAGSRRARRRPVVGVDPTEGQIEVAAARGGGAALRAGRRRAAAVRGRRVRRRRRCAWCSSTSTRSSPPSRRSPGCSRPAAGSCCFLNHPLLQTPGSGWIDDHILGEQYWRVGPYLPTTQPSRRSRPGVELPFMHRPLSRYINVMAEVGCWSSDMDEPPPPPGFLAAAPEYGEAATIPRLMLPARPSSDDDRRRRVGAAGRRATRGPSIAPRPTARLAARRVRARPLVVGAVLLLVVYARLSLLNDPRGHARHRHRRQARDAPRDGAARRRSIPTSATGPSGDDPDGSLHPLYYTSRDRRPAGST